jgi:hypothetical protein
MHVRKATHSESAAHAAFVTQQCSSSHAVQALLAVELGQL